MSIESQDLEIIFQYLNPEIPSTRAKRFEVIFGLLLWANVPGKSEDFPLLTHIKAEAKDEEKVQHCRDHIEVLNTRLYQDLITLCRHMKIDFTVFNELIAGIQKLRTDAKAAVSYLSRLVTNDYRVSYYRAIILAACHLKGIGCPISKADAVARLQEAVQIAENNRDDDNHIFVVNLAEALKEFPDASECYYKIMVLHFEQIYKREPQYYCIDNSVRSSLQGFIAQLNADEDAINHEPTKRLIQQYRKEVQKVDLCFIVERVIENLQRLSTTGFFEAADGLVHGLVLNPTLNRIYQNKNILSSELKTRLVQALWAASTKNDEKDRSLASKWLEWHFNISGSPDTAVVLADRALNGILSSQSKGATDLVAARSWYAEAVNAAAVNLDFNGISAILDKARATFRINATEGVNAAINTAVIELKVRKKVNVWDLIHLIQKEKTGGERSVDILSSCLSPEVYFPTFLQIGISLSQNKKPEEFINLLKFITAYYSRGNQSFEAEERSRVLLVLIATYNANQAEFNSNNDATRVVCSEFVEMLKREIRLHIIFCMENNLPALLNIRKHYIDYPLDYDIPSAIPKYATEVAYWYDRATLHAQIREEYQAKGLSDTADKILAFCYRNLRQNPPMLILNKRFALANVKHSEAYLATLKADVADLRRIIVAIDKKTFKNSNDIRTQIIHLGENLVKLYASKNPADGLKIYQYLGIKQISPELEGLKSDLTKLIQNYSAENFSSELRKYLEILDFYSKFAEGILDPDKFVAKAIRLYVPIGDRGLDLRHTIEESALSLLEDIDLSIPDVVMYEFVSTLVKYRPAPNKNEEFNREHDIVNKAWKICDVVWKRLEKLKSEQRAVPAAVSDAPAAVKGEKSFGYDDLLPKGKAENVGDRIQPMAPVSADEPKAQAAAESLPLPPSHLALPAAVGVNRMPGEAIPSMPVRLATLEDSDRPVTSNEGVVEAAVDDKIKETSEAKPAVIPELESKEDQLRERIRNLNIEQEKSAVEKANFAARHAALAEQNKSLLAKIAELEKSNAEKDSLLIRKNGELSTLKIEKEMRTAEAAMNEELLGLEKVTSTVAKAEVKKLTEQNHRLADELMKANAEIRKLQDAEAKTQALKAQLDAIKVPPEVPVPKLYN